jgi:hypothetical protein
MLNGFSREASRAQRRDDPLRRPFNEKAGRSQVGSIAFFLDSLVHPLEGAGRPLRRNKL